MAGGVMWLNSSLYNDISRIEWSNTDEHLQKRITYLSGNVTLYSFYFTYGKNDFIDKIYFFEMKRLGATEILGFDWLKQWIQIPKRSLYLTKRFNKFNIPVLGLRELHVRSLVCNWSR
jgi:hypothetical protein